MTRRLLPRARLGRRHDGEGRRGRSWSSDHRGEGWPCRPTHKPSVRTVLPGPGGQSHRCIFRRRAAARDERPGRQDRPRPGQRRARSLEKLPSMWRTGGPRTPAEPDTRQPSRVRHRNSRLGRRSPTLSRRSRQRSSARSRRRHPPPSGRDRAAGGSRVRRCVDRVRPSGEAVALLRQPSHHAASRTACPDRPLARASAWATSVASISAKRAQLLSCFDPAQRRDFEDLLLRLEDSLGLMNRRSDESEIRSRGDRISL